MDEGKDAESIYVTGNTVIDAMRHTVIKDYHHPELDWVGDSRMILLLLIEGKILVNQCITCLEQSDVF